MEITEQCVVALTWTLKDTLGEELDILDEPVEFLLGGKDLLPVIEAALLGYSAGATVQLQIEPELAFGDFNDQLLFLEPRHLFPDELQEGLTMEGSALPEGCNPVQTGLGLGVFATGRLSARRCQPSNNRAGPCWCRGWICWMRGCTR